MSTGMVPFVRFFAEQGTAETRVLTIRGHPVLPDDEYALLESFCDDPRCTCRRVRPAGSHTDMMHARMTRTATTTHRPAA